MSTIPNSSSLEKLKEISDQLSLLSHIHACVNLDMETASPHKSITDKSNQLAYLSALIHDARTNSLIPKLIEVVKSENHQEDDVKALLRIMSRTYRLAVSLPKDFVIEKSKLDSHSLEAWKKARKNNDFALFLPFLEKQIEMARQASHYYGYSEDQTYNGLLDIYEPDSSTQMYDSIYEPMKEFLVNIIPRIVAKQKSDGVQKIAFQNMEKVKQQRLARHLLEKIGYDFESGVLIETVHPITITLGADDVRVSSRYAPDSIEFISSTIHEGGHALYEQGIAATLRGGELGAGTSMGFHESQSRIMEVFAGQTEEFWEGMLDAVRQEFPEQTNGVTLEQWTHSLNFVTPSKIRVDADSVTYGLHVIIRYELEKDLISGKLAAKDLPKAWNSKYKEYLGVDIENDSEGCLQDIHWSDGSFGYFPTYLYGSIIAAQIWSHYASDHPEWKDDFRSGTYLNFRNWLKDNFHQYGGIYTSEELLQRAFGEKVDVSYFKEVIKQKYLS